MRTVSGVLEGQDRARETSRGIVAAVPGRSNGDVNQRVAMEIDTNGPITEIFREIENGLLFLCLKSLGKDNKRFACVHLIYRNNRSSTEFFPWVKKNVTALLSLRYISTTLTKEFKM